VARIALAEAGSRIVRRPMLERVARSWFSPISALSKRPTADLDSGPLNASRRERKRIASAFSAASRNQPELVRAGTSKITRLPSTTVRPRSATAAKGVIFFPRFRSKPRFRKRSGWIGKARHSARSARCSPLAPSRRTAEELGTHRAYGQCFGAVSPPRQRSQRNRGTTVHLGLKMLGPSRLKVG
jgi:hypothetical protein